MRSFLIAIMLLFAVNLSFAESQPPSPSNLKNAEQPNTHSKKNKGAADQSKISSESVTSTEKLLDAQGQKEAAQKPAHKHDEKSSGEWWVTPGWWVAIFTGVLAIITATLAYFTFRLWTSTKTMVIETAATSKRQSAETKESLEISRRAVITAEQSVELTKISFLASNRPRIILRDAYCSSVEIEDLITVHYVLANIGETPGTIVDTAFSIKHLDSYSDDFGAYVLPTANMGINPLGEITLQPGEQRTFTFTSEHLRWADNNGTRHDSQEQHIGVFFSGHLVYEDDRGVRRNMAFHRRHKIGPERFYRSVDKYVSALEYE